jgi:hypothetical protein
MIKASYCGPTCQREDWPRHKSGEWMIVIACIMSDPRMHYTDCKYHKMLKATRKAFQAGKPPPKDSTIPVYSADFSGNVVMINGP